VSVKGPCVKSLVLSLVLWKGDGTFKRPGLEGSFRSLGAYPQRGLWDAGLFLFHFSAAMRWPASATYSWLMFSLITGPQGQLTMEWSLQTYNPK
jgi:hypothetical protein